MRIFELVRVLAVAAAAFSGAASAAYALDDKVFDDKCNDEVKQKSSPWAVFQFGFESYKNGHKDQAVFAYRCAAENGQLGATWKLARMYAQGDGVAQDDYEAFKFYRDLVRRDVEPGSPEASYVSDALVALGGYLKSGIPGSPVEPDPTAAQDFYLRAAATYRNPSAQYELGRMMLESEARPKLGVRQAARWLQLAAAKGHAGAQARLGNLLFNGGKAVRGLAMMTVALQRAEPDDQVWIRSMQEEAFALSDETQRQKAKELSDQLMKNGK